MITSAERLMVGALQDLGVVAAGGSIPGEHVADCVQAFNELAESLGLEPLTLYQRVRTTKTLTSGTASYSIGPGGAIDLPVPLWIDAAALILDTAATVPIETLIRVFTDEDYQRESQKTQQLAPASGIWLDRGYDSSERGLVYVLPIPNVGTTQLVLYTPGGQIGQVDEDEVGADLIVPPGHARMIRKNFAIEIAPMFEVTPSGLLDRQARQSLALVKRANTPRRRKVCDPFVLGTRGAFDIDRGGVR